jgi:GntR family transcriptional regulator / MocR family aminotransferase
MRIAVVIDKSSTIPLNRQIYDFWRQGILNGQFAGGQRVPSSREVATALELSRGTVAQAYEQLISEGYFETAHGSGTYVCRQLPEALLHVPQSTKRRASANTNVQLSSFGKRLQKDQPQAPQSEGHTLLSQWGPDLSLFPLDIWHRLYARSLRSLGSDALEYTEHLRGYEPLCTEIAQYVSRTRGVVCNKDQVLVVSGSQQGLDLCARLLIEPGDEIAVENPAYSGARFIFEAWGAKPRPVPVDKEGMVCNRLGTAAKLAYVTPTHQFPTGVAWSLRRRLELIAWAREHNAIVMEDDYDSEYRYSGAPTPALQGMTDEVPIIYCGTFSKVMFPGLRVGYLILPKTLVMPFTKAKWLVDRHTATHQQAALYAFMKEGHLERHIRRTRRIYGLRREAMMDALKTYFGDSATVLGEEAGMHAYVRFDVPDLRERAARNKVQLREVNSYYIGKAPPNDYLIGFSMLSERHLQESIKRLAKSLSA